MKYLIRFFGWLSAPSWKQSAPIKPFTEMSNQELVDFVLTGVPGSTANLFALHELIDRNKKLRRELELLGVKPVPKSSGLDGS